MSGLPAHPKLGSIWREVDPRMDREVIVECLDFSRGKAGITNGERITWAKFERFNGKRGGYKLVKDSSCS